MSKHKKSTEKPGSKSDTASKQTQRDSKAKTPGEFAEAEQDASDPTHEKEIPRDRR
jgi:hypothetical protein